MLTVSEEGISITKRFFQAIDILVAQKKIRGLQTFTRKRGIPFSKMSELRNHMEVRTLKCEYIAYLCEDFNISPSWILMGKGDIFNY